jgi:hypothetical protein
MLCHELPVDEVFLNDNVSRSQSQGTISSWLDRDEPICLGSGLTGQVSAARLLFAMGRDGVLPGKIFSHLDVKNATPVNNILLMGVLTVVVSMLLSYKNAAELLNFGAFLEIKTGNGLVVLIDQHKLQTTLLSIICCKAAYVLCIARFCRYR